MAEQGALIRCGGALISGMPTDATANSSGTVGSTASAPGSLPPVCRRLKEEQGLTNSSPEVAAAVDKLLGLKQQLEAFQNAAAAAGEAAS